MFDMTTRRKIRRRNRLPLSYQFDRVIWKLQNRYARWVFPGVHRQEKRQAIIIYEKSSLCLTQIFPFFHYRRKLEKRFNLKLSFLSKDDFIARPESSLHNASLVLLQSWFTTPEDLLQSLLASVKTLNPNARIAFLDAMSPTDLRLANVLSDKIDLYIKKHVLRDRSLYGKSTRGDTNLTDFYARQYGIFLPDVTFQIPTGFLEKIIVGPSFFTADNLFGHFKFNPHADHDDKSIDIHARAFSNKTDWYGLMRQEAKDKLVQIQGITTVTDPGVSPEQYLSELRASKMCLSPFGYGEGCHRDFEAACGNSLLLKPDMAHIESSPDIFVPYETYVPIDWRFADLEPKVRHFLSHEDERRRLVDNAYRVLHDYCSTDQFLEQMKPVFELS